MLHAQNFKYAALFVGLALTVYYSLSSKGSFFYAEASSVKDRDNYILCQFFRYAAYCTTPHSKNMGNFSACIEACDDINVLSQRSSQLFFTSSNMFTTPKVDPTTIQSMTDKMLGKNAKIDPDLAAIRVTPCFANCLTIFNDPALRPTTRESMQNFYKRADLSLNNKA
jgi:hypothetical protein